MREVERSSLEELIQLVTTEADDDTCERYIRELQRRGGARVFQAAIFLLSAAQANLRRRGASILGQLDYPLPLQQRPRRADSIAALMPTALTEQNDDVVDTIAIALCWLRADVALPWLTALRHHPAPQIRLTLAILLPQFGPDHRSAVDAVGELLEDPDDDVRDWASDAFGNVYATVDHPQLRERLLTLVSDERPTTAAQAINALAARRDARVLPAVAAALLDPPFDLEPLVQAVKRFPDRTLLPGLRNLVRLADDPQLVQILHDLGAPADPSQDRDMTG